METLCWSDYLHCFVRNVVQVEAILSKSRYLTGNTITEADVRLFTTLVRFDMVYVGHFKVLKNFGKIILNITYMGM